MDLILDAIVGFVAGNVVVRVSLAFCVRVSICFGRGVAEAGRAAGAGCAARIGRLYASGGADDRMDAIAFTFVAAILNVHVVVVSRSPFVLVDVHKGIQGGISREG